MENCEVKLLAEAATDTDRLIKTSSTYATLRKLISDHSPDRERTFAELFSRYYGLNAAGLTDEWKAEYFRLLFSFRTKMPAEPHREVLSRLYVIPRRKGDQSLQCSFASKLVGIHDEAQPIFDRYVEDYFGLRPPSLRAPLEFRISGFLQNLSEISRRYCAWTKDERFTEIVLDLRQRIPDLANCHTVRICDFLVWGVGKKYSRRS
jgi:hypothetical protein